MLKKIWCLLLVFCMVITFAACSKKESKEADVDKEITTQAENPFTDFYEITWLVRFTKDYEGGRWDELEIEDKFNVDIQVWNIDANSSEEMNMMYASGDVPDFYWCTGRIIENYEQGLNRSITIKMLKEFAPDFYQAVDRYEGGWDKLDIEGKEGEQYGINRLDVYYLFPGTVHTFRLDWLENLGYAFDDLTSVDPEKRYFITNKQVTFDEINKIYRELTEEDPDGNGEDDTYARIFTPSYVYNGSDISSFGFVENSGYLYKDEVTGDYVQYFAYNGYKEYLSWITKMIEKGYIRTLPGEQSWFNEFLEASGSGNVGCLSGMFNPFNRREYDFYNTYPPQTVYDKFQEATFLIIPPYQTQDGKGWYKGYNDAPFIPGYAYCFGSGQKDEKVERILRIINYTSFGDARFRYDNGIEGVHYKWSGEPFNSPLLVTPLDKIPKQFTMGTNMRLFSCADLFFDVDQKFNYDITHKNIIKFWTDHNWYDYAIIPDKWINKLDIPQEMYTKYDEKYKEISESLNALIGDFKKRAFNGEISNINSEWQQYINALYAAGYEELVEYFNSDDWPEFKNYIDDYVKSIE